MDKNQQYWTNRIAETTWKTYNSLEDKNRDLLKMYQEATLEIQDELYRLGDKISENGVIRRSDAYKRNHLNKLMKAYEDKIYTLTKSIEIFAIANNKEGATSVYADIQKALGISKVVVKDSVIEELMRREIFGSFFSDNLWKNKKALVVNLKEILTFGIEQGKTIAEMSIQLSNRLNSDFNYTHNLVRTETMNVLTNASMKSYKDSGRVKQIQIWAAVDERLCKKCGKYHGNIYRLEDAPNTPFHNCCRCIPIPVINEEAAKLDHDKAKEEVKEELNNRKEQNKKEETKKIDEKKTKELEKIKDFKPPLAKRHRLESINKKSITKDKNTVILPYVDYNKDIEDIKAGEYNKVEDGFEINGRVYNYHDDRFYPVSGDGFITLDRQEHKLLILMKIQANNPKLEMILNNIGATKEQIDKIKNILKYLEE